MAQQVKQLESEAVSPFEKFKDLTKRLFSVDKEELDTALKEEKPVKRKNRKRE